MSIGNIPEILSQADLSSENLSREIGRTTSVAARVLGGGARFLFVRQTNSIVARPKSVF